MTIECYTSECPWHSCHTPGEEGPFCYEIMCRQYLCEQGYWMVAWNEPGEIIGSAVRSIEIREAIASSKHSAAMKGYFYLDDLEALSDFMTIHYAWFERKEVDHERHGLPAGAGGEMINNGRIEDLRRDKEAANLSKTAQSERERIKPYFDSFMDSMFWNIQPDSVSENEKQQFTTTEMFRAFMYGAREAGHLYWKQEKGEGDGTEI